MALVDPQDSKKNLTFALYLLYSLAIFSAGVLAIIALIINYLKRNEMQGTLFASHFSWQIRSFWWYLLWNILAFVPFLFLWGTQNDPQAFASVFFVASVFCFLMLGAAWIWIVYRAIRGLLALNENRPMYQ